MTEFFDDISLFATLGVISAILSFVAFLPYVIGTLAGRTHPQRACWLIWSVLGSISFFSQVYEGAWDSLWFAGTQVGWTIIIFLLSITRGTGGFLNKVDGAVLLLAAAGLVAWYVTDTSVYALAISISISLLGGLVTISQAYQRPQSENMTTWVISLVASGCAIGAVGRLDWVLLAYPLYLLTLYTAIVGAMILGRARQRSEHNVSSETVPMFLRSTNGRVAEPKSALAFAYTPSLAPQQQNAPLMTARRPVLWSIPQIRSGARARLRG